MFCALWATVCQDEPIVQVAVKSDTNLARVGNQLCDHYSEHQRGQRKAERGSCSELKDMISPNKAQPFPVSAVDHDMEVSILEVDGGGPVARSDSGPNGQGGLYLETDPLQKATE